MASNPPGQCCVTGFLHEGTPTGETGKIDNIRTYFSYPKQEPSNSSDTAIIFITDVFGMDYINSQLQADRFAESLKSTVVIPDIFNGDAIASDAFKKGSVDLDTWLKRHSTESIDPIIETTIRYLREEKGFKNIGAVGYCFGAKYVVRFLESGRSQTLDAGYIAHPSFVTHGELAAVQKPLSISASEIDSVFTRQLRYESEEILAKTGQPWQITVFSGVPHGFAVRVKLENRHQYWAKEQAFAHAVAWFVEYLK